MNLKIPIKYVDPCVSIVYRSSYLAKNEFPSYPEELRQGVSLARFVISPISELCHLWSEDPMHGKNLISSLPLDNLLDEIPHSQ